MDIIKFIFYLVWQIIKVPLSIVVGIPLCLVALCVIYPVVFVWHHWLVFKGKRSNFLSPLDIIMR